MRRKRQDQVISVVFLCLTLVLLACWGYRLEEKISQSLKEKRMQVAVVTQGNLVDSINGTALVINQELLVEAPKPGRFENLVRENEKVYKGQTLGCITDQNQKLLIISPDTGIYSTQIDGLEQVLRNPVLNATGPEIFSYQPRVVNADPKVTAGQPVCKVIDNLRPNTLIVRLNGTDICPSDIKEGGRVTLWIQGQKVGAALIREISLDNPVLVKIEMDNFSEVLLGRRYYEVTINQELGSGLLIPASALLGQDVERSVYSYKDGKIYPKKVQVKKIKDGQALVTGVELNEMVVGNPSVIEPEEIAS